MARGLHLGSFTGFKFAVVKSCHVSGFEESLVGIYSAWHLSFSFGSGWLWNVRQLYLVICCGPRLCGAGALQRLERWCLPVGLNGVAALELEDLFEVGNHFADIAACMLVGAGTLEVSQLL